MKNIKNYLLYITILIIGIQCARTGSPTGGEQDKTPPVVISTNPPSHSVNFKGNRIRLYFDEYVMLKDVRKQLIISPPINNFPEIIPSGNASKVIEIRITDTLKPNTTYTLNFGNSIQDNNEGNPLPFYKYVFSTGDVIDSLSVKGRINDALTRKPDTYVNVMLYEVNQVLTDSIVYKEKPMYITNTLDSLQTFEITNVKAGKYMLVAMKDKATNYLFDQKQDKIAFLKDTISVPTDTIYELALFKEIPNNRTARPYHSGEKRIGIGYEGERDSLKISVLPPVPDNFSYVISKEPQKDTLNFWFSPKIEDSIRLVIRNQKIDTFRVNFRKLKKDTLQISTQNKTISPVEEILTFTSNIPIVKYDLERIVVTSVADSTQIPFTSEMDSDKLNLQIKLTTKPESKYKIVAYPNALTDFYEHTNDTLQVQITSKSEADFATLKLTINKEMYFPILVELTNEKGDKVEYQKYIENQQPQYTFDFVKAGKYFVRIIEDRNRNKKWDTGNYLQRLQPEKVYHLPKEIDLRPNWEVSETYNGEPLPTEQEKKKAQQNNRKK